MFLYLNLWYLLKQKGGAEIADCCKNNTPVFVSTGWNIKLHVSCQNWVSLMSSSCRTVITIMINSFTGIHSSCQAFTYLPAFLLAVDEQYVCMQIIVYQLVSLCAQHSWGACVQSCSVLHQSRASRTVSVSQRRFTVAIMSGEMCQHCVTALNACLCQHLPTAPFHLMFLCNSIKTHHVCL